MNRNTKLLLAAAAIAAIGLIIGYLLQDAFGATDFFPPKTTVTITGTYNNYTHWYYGTAPTATFTATDDLSGVKRIIVWYKTYTNAKCNNGECLLQSGDSLKLDRQTGVNKGRVILQYFAVDNANHAEKPKTLSVYVDADAPQLYISKIHTETKSNIPVGSECKDINKFRNCVMIMAKVNETITFSMLGSDRISGVNNTFYRIGTQLKTTDAWLPVPKGIPQKLEIEFPHTGIYKLQLKVFDMAGNASPIKSFWIKIT